MKRIAVPVSKGQLSEYIGQCNHYEIFEIHDGNVKSEEIEISPDKLPLLPKVQLRRDIKKRIIKQNIKVNFSIKIKMIK